MNHRSTLAAEHRTRSGHRYRYDDEPIGGRAADGRHSAGHADPFGTRGAAAHAGYGSAARHDDGHFGADDQVDASWSTNDSWSQAESWSDGGAWNAEDSWDGESWNADDSWKAEEPWSVEEAWNSGDSRQSEEAWNADDSWEDDSWTPEDSDGWEWEEVAPESDGPAVPIVIPARRSAKRGGAHRVPAPPAALKGRAAVAAIAAGAFVAAGQAAFAAPDEPSTSIDYEAMGQVHEIAAQSMSVADPAADSAQSPQVLNVSAPADLGQFSDILQKGTKYAEDLAVQEAAKLRPLFSKFTAAGNFTSGFGTRWGVQHLGVDVAAPIGTPIYAVADGTVIEAGPAPGFGMWVRLLHDDSTVTIYGHIDTATVSQGQRVTAGDQIATVGNRGFSTGPHCHFEVWLNGFDKVDPLPWLATRGISLGPQRD